MRVLIVEDDFISRKLLQKIFSHYGECDVAVNGNEAVEAYRISLEEGKHYDLICMDLMMPDLDGHGAMRRIREIEKEQGVPVKDEVKIIVTTALDDPKNIVESMYRGGAISYVVKPIDRAKLLEEVRKMGLLA